MCGFSGFAGKNCDREDVLKKMTDKIAHRGPDQEGMFLSEQAALGFRRLSIIDLENGSQPMYNEDKKIVITFNGEIYNHLEIRKELIEKGHVFENNSDTECLIHGYEEYGTDLLHKLRGMFAFVIYDSNKDIIFGARDFFGIKPFYYGMAPDGNLVFSSEIKSILEYPDMKRELNEAALEQYLSFQYSVLPETFFKGIYRLPAGHFFLYKDGKMDVKRYFDPMMSPDSKERLSLEQVVADIEEIVHETTNAHMISDVEVGSLLSSGVDSSYVVAEFPGKKTFTVGFLDKNSKYNEIRYAEGLTKALKDKENYNKNISSEEYFDSIPKVMYYMDEPLADPSCIALYFVDKLAAEQLKVVLSGEGADEFFGGYNIYHEPISLRGFRYVPKFIKKPIAALCRKLPDFKGRDFLIRGSKTVEERFIGNANLFSVEEREKLLKTKLTHIKPMEIVAPYYKKVKGLNDIAKMQYIDINFWLQGDILLKADKMSMAHSLESRVPFLDINVFNYTKNMPVDYRCNKEATKRAFRIAAKRHLPEATANKKKLGFPVPVRVWLKEEKYYNKVLDKLTGETAKKYFDTKALRKLMEEHKEGKADNSRKIWAVYVFLIWYEVYMEAEEVKVPA
ncbi:MAG: asparagine synthase (glutamine-hydrolyzing) [Lachnospiraceae bacterium]|nr:asparagine synthase (glutamine-hydrolyzing) [Lachnospiraceae bacterium]MCI8825193.1 asparagine synthase (glutamine-hydrolyzing) [Lachnospiraceae bacterium]